MIGKIPKPKGGWTPSDYKYLGPYNPLDKQLKYDPKTGKVLSWYVKPKNKVDEIAAYHDICYDRGINKNECDKTMVKSLDKSFIASNDFHTFWANDRKSTKYTYFFCRELCLAIDFLIDNIYVRFRNSSNYWHTNEHYQRTFVG